MGVGTDEDGTGARAAKGAGLVPTRDLCSRRFFLGCKITIKELLTLCEGILRFKLEFMPQTSKDTVF